MSKLEQEQYQIQIYKNLKKYKKKMEKINNQINHLQLLLMSYDKQSEELPVPLKFNDMTFKNQNNKKSKQYTNALINKLKKRKNSHKAQENINNDQIKVKIEIQEEIEIPSLEYS
jgi:hypothetical protein